MNLKFTDRDYEAVTSMKKTSESLEDYFLRLVKEGGVKK